MTETDTSAPDWTELRRLAEAARREGIEACIAEARAEMEGLTTEGEEDAVGNVVDRIRALLEGSGEMGGTRHAAQEDSTDAR